MKNTIALALLAACSAALANGQYPAPAPAPTVDIDVAQKAQSEADARAKAAAQAKADADSESYGGGAAINDNSSTRMLVFPAPVWSTVPEARTCIATSSQAHALGWNFWSHSKTEQKSDPACIGVLMARSAYANCHFLSEALITQRVYATVFPGAPELPVPEGLRNLSLSECEELKRPKLVMSPTLASTPAPAPVALPVAAPAACVAPAPKAPVRRIVKAKPKAEECKA